MTQQKLSGWIFGLSLEVIRSFAVGARAGPGWNGEVLIISSAFLLRPMSVVDWSLFFLVAGRPAVTRDIKKAHGGGRLWRTDDLRGPVEVPGV